MIPIVVGLRHYKKKFIQEYIFRHCEDREIGVMYNQFFGKRPNVITSPRDVLELAKKGASSFHASEERWLNPLQLSSGITRKEMAKLRIGWDLLFDIDCHQFEYSRIAADLIVKFLKTWDMKNVSCKFSGNKGFHIGIPFEALPSIINGKETVDLFPELARKIAMYVTEKIKTKLADEILKYEDGDFYKIKDKTGLEQKDIVAYSKNKYGDKIPYLNVENFLEIDTILIASRHLYRVPFSLHEKSGLVSVPVDIDNILEFEKKYANPENDLEKYSQYIFLNRDVKPENIENFIMQAMDFNYKKPEKTMGKSKKEFEGVEITERLGDELFPPCINCMLKGLEDGKKRAVFIMVNYLNNLNWKKDEIKEFLMEWNKNNTEPLRETYINGQLRYLNKKMMPPSCNNKDYYKALLVCKPDSFCNKIKNPVNYSFLKNKIRKSLDNTKKRKKKPLFKFDIVPYYSVLRFRKFRKTKKNKNSKDLPKSNAILEKEKKEKIFGEN